jgi:hypothetical protein
MDSATNTGSFHRIRSSPNVGRVIPKMDVRDVVSLKMIRAGDVRPEELLHYPAIPYDEVKEAYLGLISDLNGLLIQPAVRNKIKKMIDDRFGGFR